MYSQGKTWDKLKAEYLHQVEKALASVKCPRIGQVIEDVRSHLDRRYAELELGQRTSENFQEIIAQMGPPSDYAELLAQDTTPPSRKVWRRCLLGAGFAAIIIVAVILLTTTTFWQPQPVTPEEFQRDFSKKIAKLNVDTAGLANVIRIFGEPVSYQLGNHTFDKKSLPERYCLVYPNGFCVYIRENRIVELRHKGAATSYVWRGKLRVGSSLEEVLEAVGEPVQTVEGRENRFENAVLYKDINKRKGYCYYGRADQDIRLWFEDYKIMAIYVTRSDYDTGAGRKLLKKTEIPPTSIIDENGCIVDKIDYPFVNDPEILGAWESVDFVSNIDNFKPGTKPSEGELYLKELFILGNGKTNWSFTWTKGLIIHPRNKTAAKYHIKEIDGSTYMFLEWKSGDYTIRRMKPKYYVLRKEQSDAN